MEFLNNVNQWIIFGIFFVSITGLVGISGILLNKFKVSENTSRRVVHIGVGLMVSISPFLFDNAYPAILLATIFIVLNWLALVKDKAKGMHSTERKSFGTVFFPLSFLILILLYWNSNTTALVMGMLLMAISDPFASFVGESKLGGKTYIPWADKKSIGGSLAAFISNFVLVMIFVPFLYTNPIATTSLLLIAFIVALIATLSEIISKEGTDNLTLPLISAMFLNMTMRGTVVENLWILFWIGFSILLATSAYKAKSLSVSGTFGAIFMGSIIFSIGGLAWMIPMAVFFVLSSIISKVGRSRKSQASLMAEKHDVRDIYQVYANAGIGLISSVLFHFTQNDLFYITYLASLAAAAADTWATEFGTLIGKHPRKITTFQKCLPGESGGITFPGTIAAILGAASIGLSGFFMPGNIGTNALILVIAAGFVGSLMDSLVGATLQAQYKCPNCEKITEKRLHCDGISTNLHKGIQWINNDLVNLICTLSGGLVVIFISLF